MADPETPTQGNDQAHAGHDPEVIAALLDRDATDAERLAAQALADTCAGCSGLLADLLALAEATATLPTPPRPREYTLSPAVAAGLRREPAGEPTPAMDRLRGEMIHSTPGHEAHDRILIASLVDRSIGDTERALAERQLADCRACTQLHEELVALAAATRALPVPARTREFTLTAADAERLRGSAWRRLLGRIGSSRDVFSRPLAIGFTTLGLAGLLVATVPMPFGSGGAQRAVTPVGAEVEDGSAAAGSGANPEFMTQASGAPLEPAPSGAPDVAAAAPPPASVAPDAAAASPEDMAPDVLFGGAESSQLPGELDASQRLYADDLGADATFAASPTLVVAALLLLVGLGLFGLRWTARRLGDG